MESVVRVAEISSQRVDRYELLVELAAGGMATVYLARLGGAGGFQRLYAIKRLHPHLAHEKEFVEMFLDEARLAARIHHPNVVPILDEVYAGAGYYLVMEYIEGETLARLLGRQASMGDRIPVRVGARIVLDTLAGLEKAHALRDEFGEPLNIVHRDVSPQNVMVGVDGTSRITDFGVARAATRLTTTRAGQLKGKLGYMAPEQAQGEDIDLRVDVFAVGVILWETLTGRRLFKGKPDAPDAQTLKRLLYEPIPKLQQVDSDISPAFDTICDKALSRDPAQRFASCGEFADALETVMQQCGGVASMREVAAFVDSVAGPEIASQREAVRNWGARSEVSVIDRVDPQIATQPATPAPLTSPFDLASSAKRPIPPQPSPVPQPRSHTGMIVVAVLALVFAALVGGASALLLSREETKSKAPPGQSPGASVAPGPRSPAPPPTTDPVATPSSSAGDAPAEDAGTAREERDTPESVQQLPAPSPSPEPAGSASTEEPAHPDPREDDPSSDDLNINPYRQ